MMHSKSVKTFLKDVFSEGFQEDMLIFESDFVKNYPQFSADYVDFHFKYKQDDQHNQEFIGTYDQISNLTLYLTF